MLIKHCFNKIKLLNVDHAPSFNVLNVPYTLKCLTTRVQNFSITLKYY